MIFGKIGNGKDVGVICHYLHLLVVCKKTSCGEADDIA